MFDVICPKGWCRWFVHVNILNYLDGIDWMAWPGAGGVSWRHRTVDPYAVHFSTGSQIPVVDFRGRSDTHDIEEHLNETRKG